MPVKREYSAVSWSFVVLVIIALLSWASAFAVIRAAAHEYSPGAMALLRFLVASGVLLVLAPRFGVRVPERRDGAGLLAMGLCGITIYHVALNWGEQTVTAGSAAFLVNVAPIFVLIFARLFLKERLTALRALGILICFSGASVIALSEGSGVGRVLSPGALLILLAALSSSAYMILQKSYLRKYRPFEMACFGIWGGTALLLPFLPQLVRELPIAERSATWGVVYMGIMPGALAYAIWSLILQRLSSSAAASLLYLIPILSLGLAYIMLREVPSTPAVIGGGVVLLGVAVVNWRR